MSLVTNSKAILVLEDGSIFSGIAIGVDGLSVAEVVFNTAMTGYQEILTDPSYARQLITLTYPHIGNTGTNLEDAESDHIWAAGLIIRDLPLVASNWRKTQSLQEYLIENRVVALADIDTRKLTRILRTKGALAGCIISGKPAETQGAVDIALAKAKNFVGIKGLDLAKEVSSRTAYQWHQTGWSLAHGYGNFAQSNQQSKQAYHIVAYDFGVKKNILRMFADRGCQITVVPAQTSAKEALKLKPDGIFLSNGPGDPEPCQYAIDAIKDFLTQNIPLFGICLGHQLLALALGAKTYKMKFGHHGANHPVEDIADGSVLMTSQNHGFAVEQRSLPSNVEATHQSLFDGSLQGFKVVGQSVFGFQGHPEASPGPHDCALLFDQFIRHVQIHAQTKR